MLGKLIKHNFKSTGKVMIPINIVLIAITIFGCILLSTNIFQRDELLPLAATLLIAYVLMITALSILTTIFLIVNYYRNMFSAQGYLTFTLPASSWTLLNSKIIVGFVWVLEISVMTFLSVFALIGAATGLKNLASVLSEIFIGETIIDGAGTEFSMTIFDIFGYSPAQLILLSIILLLAASFYSVAMGYGSVTIGQLYAKHKVAGSVLAYIVIYFAVQIIMSVSMMIITFRTTFDMLLDVPDAELEGAAFTEMMQSMYQPIFPFTIGLYLVLGITLYVVSGIILKKKVNLD